MAKYAIGFVRVSLGIVFLWFGALKFFPDASPAELIAQRTMNKLTMGIIPCSLSYMILAVVESLLGLLLIGNLFQKVVTALAVGHILMTFSPMVFFPSELFSKAWVPNLLGQYIIKNLVLLSALVLINHKFCYSDKETCITS
ncbi:MAG: doxx family protein [Bacteroidota bacterium]